MQGEGWVGTISDGCTCSEALFMGFKEELTCTKGTSHFCNFSILLKLYTFNICSVLVFTI